MGDVQAERELILFAENDGTLYRQSTEPVQKNLLRKAGKGTYDHELAKRLWILHAGRAFDAYEKEFGKGSLGESRAQFDFNSVARQMADDFASENDLPKIRNNAVVSFKKPVRSTFSAGEFRLEELGLKKDSNLERVFRSLSVRGQTTQEIARKAGFKDVKAVEAALKQFQIRGIATSLSNDATSSGLTVWKSTPKGRAQTIFKNATTVVDVRKGDEKFATIVGRNKVAVRPTDETRNQPISKVLRKVAVKQPKPTDRVWAVTITGGTATGDILRKQNLTLREAKSEVQRANKQLIAKSKVRLTE